MSDHPPPRIWRNDDSRVMWLKPLGLQDDGAWHEYAHVPESHIVAVLSPEDVSKLRYLADDLERDGQWTISDRLRRLASGGEQNAKDG